MSGAPAPRSYSHTAADGMTMATMPANTPGPRIATSSSAQNGQARRRTAAQTTVAVSSPANAADPKVAVVQGVELPADAEYAVLAATRTKEGAPSCVLTGPDGAPIPLREVSGSVTVENRMVLRVFDTGSGAVTAACPPTPGTTESAPRSSSTSASRRCGC